MRKTLNIAFIVGMILLSIFLVSAQTTNPWSAGSDGKEKNSFSTLDDVYVKSNLICEPATEVNLYIVYNIDNWEGGEFLEDIRGESQTIILTDSKIPLSKIISKPDAGEYDIIIDCNNNSEYDRLIDQIDHRSVAGFEVEAVAGTGKASVGKKNIGEHKWGYDPEEPKLVNEMLQLNLLAEGEDIELKNITIKAKGSGNDEEIALLEIYVDENKNGKVDVNEIMIGDFQPAYTADDGKTTINLDYFLTKGLEENILVAYTMKESIEEGEFSLTVESIYGIGEDSSSVIKFSGLPVDSGKKTAIPKKTCLGILSLNLNPNPVSVGLDVSVSISNLSGCSGKRISLRKNPCGASVAEEVNSCTLDDKGACEIVFTASTAATYHACIDKNKDGDMVDIGEYAYEELAIKEKEIAEEAEEENVTEEEGEVVEKETEEVEETGENDEITGRTIGGSISEVISQTNSFFILLEVTLLLILFVLVMILFKLKGPPAQSEKTEEKEEKTEKKKKSKEEESD